MTHTYHYPNLHVGLAVGCPRCEQLAADGRAVSPDFTRQLTPEQLTDAVAMLDDAWQRDELTFDEMRAAERTIRNQFAPDPQLIPRDVLRDFLSRHTAPGADFPTGARMQAAGHAHAIADTDGGGGYDYSQDDVALSIAEWVSMADARRYLLGYSHVEQDRTMRAAQT